MLLADFCIKCCSFRYVKFMNSAWDMFDLTNRQGKDICKVFNGFLNSNPFSRREIGSDFDVSKNFCDALRFEGGSSMSEYGCVNAHRNFGLFSAQS
jgi:hypothetical protein